MAEWSKALRSGRSPLLWAGVRISLLTSVILMTSRISWLLKITRSCSKYGFLPRSTTLDLIGWSGGYSPYLLPQGSGVQSSRQLKVWNNVYVINVANSSQVLQLRPDICSRTEQLSGNWGSHLKSIFEKWRPLSHKSCWPRRDLNTQPSDLESDALPLRHGVTDQEWRLQSNGDRDFQGT